MYKTPSPQFHILKGIQHMKWHFHYNIKVQKCYVYRIKQIKLPPFSITLPPLSLNCEEI